MTTDLETLTKAEKSILLYAETCMVDGGGLLESRRMNGEDFVALGKYQTQSVLKFGRIPFRAIEAAKSYRREPTHWVTFTDRAWEIAHALRRQRAETQPGNTRKMVDAAIKSSTMEKAA